jgi:hypothetical protein
MIRTAIAKRLLECGLELHPEKTRIIYCKDDLRKGRHTDEKFDFLGYEFRPRESKNRHGKVFANFSPAVSTKAAKSMRQTIRGWRLRHCSHQSLEDLSRLYDPILRGWIQYYGRYTAPGFALWCDNWMMSWSSGPDRSTRSCAVMSGVHGTGLRRFPAEARLCSLPGRYFAVAP